MQARYLDGRTGVRCNDLFKDHVVERVRVRVGNVVRRDRVADRGDIVGSDNVVELAAIISGGDDRAGAARIEWASSGLN